MLRACALVVLAGLTIACSDGERHRPATTTTTVESGSAPVVADAVAHDGVAARVTDTALPTTEGTVLLVFDQLPFQPGCLVALQLVMHATAGTGELAVYPGLETALAEFTDGTPLGGVVLRSNRPRSTATVDAAPASVRWDVLDHYRRDPYVRYPTATEEPFALAIRTKTLVDPTTVVLESRESGHGAELVWSARPGCR